MFLHEGKYYVGASAKTSRPAPETMRPAAQPPPMSASPDGAAGGVTDWLKRMVMRSIVRKEGGDIDTSQDYEYTDWESLWTFVGSFLEVVETARNRDAVGAAR